MLPFHAAKVVKLASQADADVLGHRWVANNLAPMWGDARDSTSVGSAASVRGRRDVQCCADLAWCHRDCSDAMGFFSSFQSASKAPGESIDTVEVCWSAYFAR